MGNNFLKVADRQTLDDLLDASNDEPVVVFKHSTSCPISATAYREMEKFEGNVNLVVVQSAREVSLELAKITGIRHESPQVIVLRNRRAVWNASHYAVKASAVTEATQSNS